MANLTVVAHVRAKKGKEDETRNTLLALVEPTRREAGCLNYDLHQCDDDPALFVFYENWTAQAALDAHLNTPHVQGVLARAGELLASPPDIKTYTMISAPAKI